MVIRLFTVLVAALLRLTLPLYLQYRVAEVCAIVARIYMYGNCLLVIHSDLIIANVCATLQAIGHMIVDTYCALELHVMSQATLMLI